MSLPSLKQWDEDRKTLGVVYDHSRAKPVERKNKIKKSRQVAFKSALAERTKPSRQHQDTKTNTSGSSLGKEQCGAQARRDEASSQRGKKTHHMIQFFIKTSINRKNLCLRLDRNTTVSALKDIIHRKLGIRPALQNLYTNNQRFKFCDALTLLDHGIEPDTNIDLTLATGLLGGAPTLDETFIQTLALDLVKDWQQLADKLKFRPAEIRKFERLAESNPEGQANQMLVSWWEEQTDHREAEEWLRSALVQIGRRDLAAKIPGYAPTSPRAGNKRQSSEHQSISDTTGIDNKMLRRVAENIGKDWKRLGTSLGIKAAQIENYESDYPSDQEEQAYQMLLGYFRKQEAAEDGLKKALIEIDRADIVKIITDVMGQPSKALVTTLVSHYKETMKVNTHPAYKDLAVDMDQLCVNLELLQETNQPDQPIILQSGSVIEKHKPEHTVHPGIEGEHEIDKIQTKYKKIPLKSYEDMLSFDKKRILITAESGYGKSTLLKKIAYDWAVLRSDDAHQKEESPLSKYELVFLLEINKMKGNLNIMDEIFTQKLLPQNQLGKKDLENYMTQYPEKVLILLDGADEISFQTLETATEEDFSVINVLSFESLKRCKVIVTSRQSTALKLRKCNPDFTRVNILGFDDKNKRDYIQKYFSNYDSQHKAHVLSEINKSKTLQSLGQIPLFFWLMCELTVAGKRLPDRITDLLKIAIDMFYEQQMSKDCTSQPPDKMTEERFNELMTELGQVALDSLSLKSHANNSFEVSDFGSGDLFNFGCKVGLLTPVEFMYGIKKVKRVQFYHMIFMQFCCSVYLSDLVESNPDNFEEHLSKLLEGDVERFEYLIRFCSGSNKTAAECVIKLTKEHLHSVYDYNTLFENERYVCLHKIMMLALFEAKLGSTVETLERDEWVRFPYELKGEDLLSAHYFIQNLTGRSSLRHVSDIMIMCVRKTDINLLEEIKARIGCNLSLVVAGVNMNEIIHKLQIISNFLTSLTLRECKLSCVSVPRLFQSLASATKLKKVYLSGDNLHGLKSDQIPRISSLEILILQECKLTRDDIGPLLSIEAAAGSVLKLILHKNDLHKNDLHKNDLHGIKGDQITRVSSLELHLYACGIQSDDIGPLFSIMAAAGSVTKLFLKDNNLHGIKGDQITSVSSLEELHLIACGIESDDVGPLFSIMAAAGSVTKFSVQENDLHGIKRIQITPVSSLNELQLLVCSLKSVDIVPLLSIVAAAGSVTKLVLQGNDLHGIEEDQITPVSSLKELFLCKCSLKSDDIEPLFSIVAAAGSLTRLVLNDNELHGIKGDQITSVSSLKELHLYACDMKSDDIGPLFSIMAAAGSVTTLVLKNNELHGIGGDQITSVSSLKELHLIACSLKSDDIGPLFSTVAAAGSITMLALGENDLHGIMRDQVIPVSSLKELHLIKCKIQSDDISPLLSIVATAGSIKKVGLNGNNLRGIQVNQITPVSSLEFLNLTDCGLQDDDVTALSTALNMLKWGSFLFTPPPT